MKIIEDEIINKILLIIIIALTTATLLLVVFKGTKKENTTQIIENKNLTKEEIPKEETPTNTKISIDVKGAVQNPGVYELEYGSRVNDAINAAGGLKKEASTKYLNLSKKIKDETVIKVYTEKQINNMQITFEVKEECTCPEQEIIDCAGSNIIESTTTQTKSEESNSTSEDSKNKEETNTTQETTKISINTATIDQLTSLNGIGESKAKAIIEYRDKNNGFKTIEEIMNVSGIGEAAFNKIKDYITT